MEENASFNSFNALSFHGLSSIPCSGVSTCQMLLPLCFFHFYSVQRLRILEDNLKCLCSFPPRTSFSTVVQQTCSFFIIVKNLFHCCNLSAFSLSPSFSHSFCLRQPNGPCVPLRFIHITHPTYPLLVRKLALLCLNVSPVCGTSNVFSASKVPATLSRRLVADGNMYFCMFSFRNFFST